MSTSSAKRKLLAGLAAGTLAVFGVAACEVDDDFDNDLMEEPADDPFEDDAGEPEDDL